jgi:hypothetical protein
MPVAETRADQGVRPTGIPYLEKIAETSTNVNIYVVIGPAT